MTAAPRLDFRRIASALAGLGTRDLRDDHTRDPLDTHVVSNMVAGYALAESLVREDIDIFAMGSHKYLLALNRIVLCGNDAARAAEYADHLAATEKRFYEEANAGIEDVAEWLRMHRRLTLRDRVAGVYVRMLAVPQLFIEGNQRTGMLVMTYLSMREGGSPYVLGPSCANDFFAISESIRDTRKTTLGAMVRLPRLRRRLADLLERTNGTEYLLATNAGDRASALTH